MATIIMFIGRIAIILPSLQNMRRSIIQRNGASMSFDQKFTPTRA
ncbi:MAG: hypothetical protein V4512_00180 [Pseudomonadota bacterium]